MRGRVCCYDKSQIVLCAGTAWGGHLGVGRRADDAVCVLLGGEPVTAQYHPVAPVPVPPVNL